MAQATILAAAKTVATSSDLTVAAGDVATVGIFTDAAAGIPAHEGVTLYIDTPSADKVLKELTGIDPVAVVAGPCTVRAKRRVTTTNIGVFTES